MKRLLFFIIATAAFAACEKSNPGKSSSDLTGKWKLTEARSDPGDGSGRWHPVDQDVVVIIEFKTDGSFISNENFNEFDRYTIHGDSVSLFNSLNSSIQMPIAIQELNSQALSYYYGWPWCGGPTGRKFVRL
jgi:hypothetical protein